VGWECSTHNDERCLIVCIRKPEREKPNRTYKGVILHWVLRRESWQEADCVMRFGEVAIGGLLLVR
jgi:hypothetical protein